MSASTDVPTETYTPELFSIKLVRINKDRSRIGAFHALRIVLVVVRNPFHNQFIFAVAIQVANAHVVGIVIADRLCGIRHDLTCGAVQFKHLVRERFAAIRNRRVKNETRGLLRSFLAAHDSRNSVFRSDFSCRIQIVCPSGFSNGGDFCTVTVKIELRVGAVRTKQAPRN